MEEEAIGSEVLVNVGAKGHVNRRNVVIGVDGCRLGSRGQTKARGIVVVSWAGGRLAIVAPGSRVHYLQSLHLAVLLLLFDFLVPQVAPALRDAMIFAAKDK